MQGTRKNQENYQNIKKSYQENPDIQRAYEKSMYQEKKKRCGLGNSNKQVKQGPCYIFTICHRSLYQDSVKLFMHEKYSIVTAELYHLMKSFDEKLHIYEICQEHFQ